ncbi:MAG: 5-formyltetrahydrofolate cyclo-ligase, partial [Cyanobacteriota bacterium]
MEKKKIRQQLINTREALSKKEWEEKSLALGEHLQQFLANSTNRTILSYFYFRQEPNLDPLFDCDQYDWGVPRCVGKELRWHFYQPSDPLEKGKFGIREPKPESPICPPEKVDLILVPAVACDDQVYRLGYG